MTCIVRASDWSASVACLVRKWEFLRGGEEIHIVTAHYSIGRVEHGIQKKLCWLLFICNH